MRALQATSPNAPEPNIHSRQCHSRIPHQNTTQYHNDPQYIRPQPAQRNLQRHHTGQKRQARPNPRITKHRSSITSKIRNRSQARTRLRDPIRTTTALTTKHTKRPRPMQHSPHSSPLLKSTNQRQLQHLYPTTHTTPSTRRLHLSQPISLIPILSHHKDSLHHQTHSRHITNQLTQSAPHPRPIPQAYLQHLPTSHIHRLPIQRRVHPSNRISPHTTHRQRNRSLVPANLLLPSSALAAP